MKIKLGVSILFIAAALAGCSTSSEKSKSNAVLGVQAKSVGMPLALKVKGNQVIDANGHPVLLRGVNAAALEWSSDG
ncbi:MAG TPA: hypothetical protein VIK28_11310, partial [Sedimentisphaerales bacterium]